MTAYVIFEENVLDAEAFEDYKRMSPQSIAAHGGEFLVRGGSMEMLEGSMDYQRVVVIAFPTLADARAWYDSDAYAQAKALRLRISEGRALLVAGVPADGGATSGS